MYFNCICMAQKFSKIFKLPYFFFQITQGSTIIATFFSKMVNITLPPPRFFLVLSHRMFQRRVDKFKMIRVFLGDAPGQINSHLVKFSSQKNLIPVDKISSGGKCSILRCSFDNFKDFHRIVKLTRRSWKIRIPTPS